LAAVEKREIAARAKILAELIYKKEIVDRMFAEVIRMLRLEESETYRELIKKGEKEGKLEVAKELLKRGMNIDEIAEITKLSKEEIKKLLN
jgi:predicted transposase/invertase (TIGR01784 family)